MRSFAVGRRQRSSASHVVARRTFASVVIASVFAALIIAASIVTASIVTASIIAASIIATSRIVVRRPIGRRRFVPCSVASWTVSPRIVPLATLARRGTSVAGVVVLARRLAPISTLAPERRRPGTIAAVALACSGAGPRTVGSAVALARRGTTTERGRTEADLLERMTRAHRDVAVVAVGDLAQRRDRLRTERNQSGFCTARDRAVRVAEARDELVRKRFDARIRCRRIVRRCRGSAASIRALLRRSLRRSVRRVVRSLREHHEREETVGEHEHRITLV
jgi:hypothetical protein